MGGNGWDAEATQELPDGKRFVICGENSLAYRLADELANRLHGEVTVIVRSHASAYGSMIAKLTGVRLIEAARPHPDAFGLVDLSSVEALALVDSNDVANIDAALAAHEVNPDLRMVVRMFNRSLGEGLNELPYCTVVSDGELAAPAFVAAALGDVTSTLGIGDGRMHVVRPEDVPVGSQIVCGLAVTGPRDQAELLPADQRSANLMLVQVARPAPARAKRPPRLTHRYSIRTLLSRVWRRIRLVLAIFAGLLLLTTAVLATVSPTVSWGRAGYTALLIALGAADVELDAPVVEQVVLAFLTVASFLLIPFLVGAVVDAVVKARLDFAEGAVARRASGHVVVVGLGNVGSNVIRLLYDQGVDVVAIDRSGDARGVQLARDLRIPLIIGDATRPDTLIAASVPTCRTLVVVTSHDVTNLESALVGRSIARQSTDALHVVLRLFDGEFAARIQRTFHLTTSRSVSYLAVPSFAARMLGQALDTIPVGRRVLLVAELTIGPHSELASGRTIGDLQRPGEAWLLSLTSNEGERLPPTTAPGRRLHHGEVLLMVATKHGLARLIAETATPPDSAPRPPLVLHDTPLLHPSVIQREAR